MKFVSTASIFLKSGKGGDGIISWRRESRVRMGGPAGGSGGKGGSVYIEADENLNSLFHVRHIKSLKAKNGEQGRNKAQHGKDAEDVYLKVPCGTNLFDKSTGEKLYEFINHGEKYLVCKGGEGGRGNCSFKSSRMQAPYLYELGDPAEEKEVLLDLQSISDIGLLGKPNAGKSSLLSQISNAKPKIASFPFTTLIPVLGTVNYKNKKLVFADIPGLIENASNGAGLGIEFLKHLNRCRILIHLVDISNTELISNITSIEKEISNYSEKLFQKPRILVLNKSDLLSKNEVSSISKEIENQLQIKPIIISTKEKTGIDELLEQTFSLYEKEMSDNPKIEKQEYLEIKDNEEDFQPLKVEKQDDIWIISHPKLKYWVYKIPTDTIDNRARLLQKIESYGVNQELIKAGAQKGDMVNLHGLKYEFLGT
ncbi:GTPase ObgE/CgtA [Candidatus Mycoplasma haematohominis]|uniref:GTPase Obg n=1 Tax=Candidatus Mycoplasma haematohominis TaxID=1494318 RepID=A0A478FV75_9MOLU|nr:GTPase ObgE/CgtA [Candidatus Mycoplasma haemohominis]